MFYIYVLKSVNYKKSYVGKTNDIGRRLIEHNNGKSKFTAKFRPWVVLYQEQFTTNNEAVEREKFYKSRIGRKKLKEIFNNN